MTIKTSGALTATEIQSEFGGSPPITMAEYYGAAPSIPTSGQISYGNFYGASVVGPDMLVIHPRVGINPHPLGEASSAMSRYVFALVDTLNQYQIIATIVNTSNISDVSENLIHNPNGLTSFIYTIEIESDPLTGEVYMSWITVPQVTNGPIYYKLAKFDNSFNIIWERAVFKLDLPESEYSTQKTQLLVSETMIHYIGSYRGITASYIYHFRYATLVPATGQILDASAGYNSRSDNFKKAFQGYMYGIVGLAYPYKGIPFLTHTYISTSYGALDIFDDSTYTDVGNPNGEYYVSMAIDPNYSTLTSTDIKAYMLGYRQLISRNHLVYTYRTVNKVGSLELSYEIDMGEDMIPSINQTAWNSIVFLTGRDAVAAFVVHGTLGAPTGDNNPGQANGTIYVVIIHVETNTVLHMCKYYNFKDEIRTEASSNLNGELILSITDKSGYSIIIKHNEAASGTSTCAVPTYRSDGYPTTYLVSRVVLPTSQPQVFVSSVQFNRKFSYDASIPDPSIQLAAEDDGVPYDTNPPVTSTLGWNNADFI